MGEGPKERRRSGGEVGGWGGYARGLPCPHGWGTGLGEVGEEAMLGEGWNFCMPAALARSGEWAGRSGNWRIYVLSDLPILPLEQWAVERPRDRRRAGTGLQGGEPPGLASVQGKPRRVARALGRDTAQKVLAAKRVGADWDPRVLLPHPHHLWQIGWRSDCEYSFYQGRER